MTLRVKRRLRLKDLQRDSKISADEVWTFVNVQRLMCTDFFFFFCQVIYNVVFLLCADDSGMSKADRVWLGVRRAL